MERHVPSKKILGELAGNDIRVVRYIHHGLSETHLEKVYPLLNLNETLGFAAVSWSRRLANPNAFTFITPQNIPESLLEPFGAGFRYLNKESSLREENATMNPHKDDLIARLETIPLEVRESLIRNLRNRVKRYEGEYHRTESPEVEVVSPFPRPARRVMTNEEIISNYLTVVHKILSRYPTEVHELQISLQI